MTFCVWVNPIYNAPTDTPYLVFSYQGQGGDKFMSDVNINVPFKLEELLDLIEILEDADVELNHGGEVSGLLLHLVQTLHDHYFKGRPLPF